MVKRIFLALGILSYLLCGSIAAQQYPSAISTTADLLPATNTATSYLTASLNSSQTTITVASTALFPASSVFSIDNEIVHYTGKTATTFTGCTRAYDGTTAATHKPYATVSLRLVAAHHNVLVAEVVALETELGVLPKGSDASVVARLDRIDLDILEDFTLSGASPSITMTDTTASAKSTKLLTDANLFSIYESGATAQTGFNFDLTNNRTLFPVGTKTLPAIGANTYTTTGLYWATGPLLKVTVNDTDIANFSATTLTVTGNLTVTGSAEIDVNEAVLGDLTMGVVAADNSAVTRTIFSANSSTDVAGTKLAIQAGKGSGTTYGPVLLQPSGGTVIVGSKTTITTGADDVLTINPVNTVVVTAGNSGSAIKFTGTVTEAASGVHSLLAGVNVATPTITAGVATVTDVATMYVGAAPSGTFVNTPMALFVAGQSKIAHDAATTNTVLDVLSLERTTSGAADAGIGAALVFKVEDSAGTLEEAGRINASFPVATHATQTGLMEILPFGATTGQGLVITRDSVTGVVNVGVGINPLIKFHVTSNVTKSGADTSIVRFGSLSTDTNPLGLDVAQSYYGSRYHIKLVVSQVGLLGADLDINDAMTVKYAGNVDIGNTAGTYRLGVQQAGTAKSTTDIVSIVNSGNAADMDGTGAGLLFRQFYYDAATPAVASSGRISIVTETDWTSTASTQDASMLFGTALNGTITTALTLGSDQSATFAGNLNLPNTGVIGFNSSAYTLTHSTGLLTTSGAFTVGGLATFSKATVHTPIALTETADAVALDASLGDSFTLTPTDDDDGFTLSNPTGGTVGQRVIIKVTNPGAVELITYGANYTKMGTVGAAPLSTGSGDVTYIGLYFTSATAADVISISRTTEP